MVTIDKIFHAQMVLKNIIRPTPLAKAYGIAPECNLYFKPENLQNTGSFKLRGSGYKIAQLSDEEKAKGKKGKKKRYNDCLAVLAQHSVSI